MKKYFIKTFAALFFVAMLSFNGCILDAFNTLTQNIPITQEFSVVNSSKSSYSQTDTVDLSSSTTYQNYSDKIQNINYATAEFRTKSILPQNLSANVSITLKDSSGNLLFTYPLGTITPADYKNTPYQLSLTAAQIQLINNYLSTLSNKKFQATLSITNISPVPYSLDAVVDIVFKMKTKT